MASHLFSLSTHLLNHVPGAFCVPLSLAVSLVLPPEPKFRHLLNHLCGHAKFPMTKSISVGHAVCGLGTNLCCSPASPSFPLKGHLSGGTPPTDLVCLRICPRWLLILQTAHRFEFGKRFQVCKEFLNSSTCWPVLRGVKNTYLQLTLYFFS